MPLIAWVLKGVKQVVVYSIRQSTVEVGILIFFLNENTKQIIYILCLPHILTKKRVKFYHDKKGGNSFSLNECNLI